MVRRFVNYLLRFHTRQNSIGYRVISLLFGMLFFLGVLPAIFILIASFIDGYCLLSINRGVELVISVVSIAVGLSVMAWTTLYQWKVGKGVPAPNAPTQRLVTSGPYKFCRNPIELGAIFYYLGAGIIFGGFLNGLVCFLLGLIAGSVYHKFVEERELEARFGDEYLEYKKNTPFLFPRFKW